MNNDYLNSKDDMIGIDPTRIPEVDNLDLDSDKKTVKKLPKRTDDKVQPPLIKKILFTIVVLLSMAGVSYGVYYYLSLGSSNSPLVLKDLQINVGDELPSNIMEYGDFSNVDIAKCTLDVLEVDVNNAGQYNYSVMCGEVKYTAKIIVNEKIIFDLATNIVYKTKEEKVNADEFINSEKEYTYSFVEEEKMYPNGINQVKINVTDENGRSSVVTGLLYITDAEVDMSLSCKKKISDSGDYTSSVIDKYVFDNNNENMNITIRIYQYSFSSNAGFEEQLKLIKNGMIKIQDHEGMALIDYVNKEIGIVSTITNEQLMQELGQEIPSSYREVNNIYRRIRGYRCSI